MAVMAVTVAKSPSTAAWLLLPAVRITVQALVEQAVATAVRSLSMVVQLRLRQAVNLRLSVQALPAL